MTDHNLCPDSTEDSDASTHSSDNSFESNRNSNKDRVENQKFPSDDSNVGDNPIYPKKEDLVPVNDIEVNADSETNSDNQDEIELDETVGSTQGTVYPYNINSNTSDDINTNEDTDKKDGPLDSIRDEDYVTSNLKSDKSNI
jgi:hypothetical protein